MGSIPSGKVDIDDVDDRVIRVGGIAVVQASFDVEFLPCDHRP
jgi:hypothetical protein